MKDVIANPPPIDDEGHYRVYKNGEDGDYAVFVQNDGQWYGYIIQRVDWEHRRDPNESYKLVTGYSLDKTEYPDPGGKIRLLNDALNERVDPPMHDPWQQMVPNTEDVSPQ